MPRRTRHALEQLHEGRPIEAHRDPVGSARHSEQSLVEALVEQAQAFISLLLWRCLEKCEGYVSRIGAHGVCPVARCKLEPRALALRE